MIAALGGMLAPHLLAPASAQESATAAPDTLRGSSRWGWIRGQVYDLVVSEPTREDTLAKVLVEGTSPFAPFAGRWIRNIHIVRLEVLGDGVVGQPANDPALRSALNTFHLDTREWVVRRYVLPRSGEALDPLDLAETERSLRETRHIQDARVLVVPVPGAPDSVDLAVVTRDVWSLGASVKIKTETKYKVTLFERNMLGLGHDMEHKIDVDQLRPQRLDYTASYTLPNMFGTRVRTQGLFADHDAENRLSMGFLRPFDVPQIELGGEASFGIVKKHDTQADSTEATQLFQDVALARAFFLRHTATDGSRPNRLFAGARVARVEFSRRPEVAPDSNRAYHDRVLLLGSVGFSRSGFFRGRKIFGFGSTEDIPYGFRAGLTGGGELGEFGDRPYAGLEVGGASHRQRFGYLDTRVTAGSFFAGGELSDGVVDARISYFTGMLSLGGNFALRSYADVLFTQGFGRESGESLPLEVVDGVGVRGLDTSLRGPTRLLAGVQTSLFTPWSLVGFKLAFVPFAELGSVADDAYGLRGTQYASSLGMEIRIRHERLDFDTLHIRFAWFPSEPVGASTQWLDVYGAKPRLIPSFDPTLPGVASYR